MDDNQSSVEEVIMQFDRNENSVLDIPEECRDNIQVIKAERRNGLRITTERGYDVITDRFFVKEDTTVTEKYLFQTFEEYYDFLNGDIYQDACYRFYNFPVEIISKYSLDVCKMKERKSFVTDTVTDYYPSISENEKLQYKKAEKVHEQCCKWIQKFNDCMTIEELQEVVKSYRSSKLCEIVNEHFFFFNYIYKDLNDKKRFNIIMQYISSRAYPSVWIQYGMCVIFDPDDVVNAYIYNPSFGAKANFYKSRNVLVSVAEKIKAGKVKLYKRYYFDSITHFFCEETRITEFKHIFVESRRYFKTFEEFSAYRKNNLKNTDLSSAYELHIDKKDYIIDETTKLPLTLSNDLFCETKKEYHKIHDAGVFSVQQEWKNEYGAVVAEYTRQFEYFFDFAAFLKDDLSGANLIFCKGMKHLYDTDGINLNCAKMTSELCEQLHVPYEKNDYDSKLVGEFLTTTKNEKESISMLQTSREESLNFSNILGKDNSRISYISDLHLMHKIKNAKCRSKEDVIYMMQTVIDIILTESTSITLIGGDVSSEFSVFELFIKMLRQSVEQLQLEYGAFFKKRDFIFVLGNHELWSFPELSMEEIVSKYRAVLEENGMYLLHNDLFYRNEYDDVNSISYDELTQLDNSTILKMMRHTRLAILGGLGFSGYNEEFNATDGVYRATIDRNTEIQESKKFEQLYNKLMSVLTKKNTIIFTHMPMKDWCAEVKYHDNFVYVSGHTHRNIFFDDGVERVYADNQIGYNNENPHLKNFLIEMNYDYFDTYKDGIYEITVQDYKDFFHGKNISMTFNRQVNVLYMLKKQGYYCFIHKTKAGKLSMLNGGAFKKLDVKDVQYYFDNMDKMVAFIEEPLKKYTDYQNSISKEINKIGGCGRIHGCIIDIDYYNHIYVNPTDLTITGYWASDIINKLVYPNVPALLESKCPILYANYLKLIEENDTNYLLVKQIKNEVSLLPQEYLETDIYKASREIKKMQKLSSKILTLWYENMSVSNFIIEETV